MAGHQCRLGRGTDREQIALALIHDLVDNLLGAADENRAAGAGALFVDLPRDFAREVCARRVFAEIGAVMGVELIKSSLRGRRHVDVRRYGDLQRAWVMSSFGVALPIGGDLTDEIGGRL